MRLLARSPARPVSFRRLMLVIAIEIIPLSPLSTVLTIRELRGKVASYYGKNIVQSTDIKKLNEIMDRCPDCHNITENNVVNGIEYHASNQPTSTI